MTTPETRRPAAVIDAGWSLYAELLASRKRIEGVPNDALVPLGLPTIASTLRADAALAPRQVRLTMEAGDGTEGHLVDGLPAGSIVVRSSALHVGARFKVAAEPWPDPEDPTRGAALIRGTTVEAVDPELGAMAFDPVGAVVVAFGAWMRRHAARTVDHAVAARLLCEIPGAAAAALLKTCGIDAMTELLAALVDEGVPVHALAEMAPMLSDEERVSWAAPGLVTAAFPGRSVIAAPRPDAAAARRLVIARAVAVPAALRRRAGAAALQAWVVDEQSGWIPPDDGGPDSVAFDALLAERAAAAATVSQAIVVTSSARRAEIARRVRRSHPGTMVVAVHELPRGVRLQRRARIVLPTPPPHPDAARSRP